MATRTIGIILHGATGRIGSTQHLQNALAPIRDEGGLRAENDRIVPRVMLVGRNPERLAALAQTHRTEWTTDVEAALKDPDYTVLFDAAATHARVGVLERALAAGKHVYTEKPVAPSAAQGLALLREAQRRGLKHGAVEDKVYLPGLQKLAALRRENFFGRIVSFRLEFGYWIFDGIERASQRSSWNYRRAGGGGLVLDMYAHWRYVIEALVGRIRRVSAATWTAIPERVDERGHHYQVDVEDSALTLVEIEGGARGAILSSWATRVRRDDLFVLQVDGTKGSAVAGLHRCHTQNAAQTPLVPGFNVTKDIGADYRADWQEVPAAGPYQNPYRAGWEKFLRHVACDEPLRASLAAGIRDVQFAETCCRSAAEGRWVDFEDAS